MKRYTFAIVLLVLITKGCCGMYDTTTEEQLQLSAGRNTWGQQLNLYSATQSVINVDLPPWMARAWTLNLTRFRYSQGTIPTGGNNSTDPNAHTIGNDTKVRLDYGVDGAMEQVRFDYPRQGGTVQFHAAVIRVYFEAPAFAGLGPGAPGQTIPLSPLVGAFITPHPRGQLTDWQPPTLTLAGVVVGSDPVVSLVQVPVRAKAYRLIPVPGFVNTLTTDVFVRQATGAGAFLSFDYASDSFGLGETIRISAVAGEPHLYPYRGLWIPLEQNTEQLIMTTGAAAGTVAVRPQFLLDLG